MEFVDCVRIVHFTRNIIDATPKALQKDVAAQLRTLFLFTATDPQAARLLLRTTLETFSERAPAAMLILEGGVDDATAVLALPTPYRARLRTTNAQQRLNEELRRRERLIRIFPSRTSVLRLLGALLMELEEQWTTGHRYLAMETYWQWKLATETAQKGGTSLVQIA